MAFLFFRTPPPPKKKHTHTHTHTNLVEDVATLLPIKFSWIPFNGFREKVKNVSTNQSLGRSSYYSDRPEKHKLGRGRCDVAPCQVLLNSVQRFQRNTRKCLSQSEAKAAFLFFRSARKKNTNCVEDVEILHPLKFRCIPISGFRGEVEMAQPTRDQDGHLVFSDYQPLPTKKKNKSPYT